MIRSYLHTIKNLSGSRLYDAIFIVLLIVGFLIRLNGFYSITYTEDGSRDFLVAHHIVKYHEFPSTGPANSDYSTLKNSPLYFYFLAFFLLFNDNFIFLGLINVFLQMATIIIIYLLAKKMFNPSIAIIASTLFNFSQSILIQSNFLWQPWVSQPFVNLSYLLLFIFYRKKNYLFLILGISFFIFAGVLHRSNFALIPLISFIIWVILKQNSYKNINFITKSINKYFFIIIYSFLLIVLFNLPLIIYFINTNQNLNFLPSNQNQSLGFMYYLQTNFSTLLNMFFVSDSTKSFGLDLISIYLVSSSIIALALYQSRKNKFFYNLLIIMYAILCPVIMASLMKLDSYRYLTPVLGLFIILISASINIIFTKNITLRILEVVVVILILRLSSPDLSSNLNSIQLLPKNMPNSAIATVEQKVLSLHKEENIPNFNFFDFKSIKDGYNYGYVDAAFWANLEADLDVKLVELDDANIHNYRIVNNGRYIFLICYRYEDITFEETSCKDKFVKESRYSVIEKIYSHYPFSIYLTKRVS